MEAKCCPFCGAGYEGLGIGPLDDPGYDSARVAVGCQQCGCRGPSAPDEGSAVGYWNQRSEWGRELDSERIF